MRTLTSPAPATAPTRRRTARGPACEEPPRLWGEPAPARPAPEPVAAVAAPAEATPAADVATLEDLISGAWEGLSAAGAIACPVCTGPMTPRWSAGAGVVGGRCGDCGTTLQ